MHKHKTYSMGQGLPEYALLFVFVAIAVIVILAYLGQTIDDTFRNIIDLI